MSEEEGKSNPPEEPEPTSDPWQGHPTQPELKILTAWEGFPTKPTLREKGSPEEREAPPDK